LGVLLAAPTLATFRVIGRYVLRRLYDRDPFVEPLQELVEKEEEEERPPLEPTIDGPRTVAKKVGEAALEHLQKKVKKATRQYADGSDSTGTSRQ
jgi:hypothetical protein